MLFDLEKTNEKVKLLEKGIKILSENHEDIALEIIQYYELIDMNDSLKKIIEKSQNEKKAMFSNIKKLKNELEKTKSNISKENNQIINTEKKVSNEAQKKNNANDNINIVFTSSNSKIRYEMKCLKSDLFAKIEDRFYKKYTNFRETNNMFNANGKPILRFKKLSENNIKDGDIIQLFILG